MEKRVCSNCKSVWYSYDSVSVWECGSVGVWDVWW